MLEQIVIDGKTVELPQTPSTAAWTYAGNRGHMPNMVVCYDQSRLSGAVMFRDDEGNQIGPWRVFCPIDNQEFADLVARLSLEYGGLELDAKKLF